MLAWAEGHDLARPHPAPAPDQARSTTDRQRNQDQVGRHRDEGNPRQLLLGRRQAHAVQLDLGQPRPELATTGDQQTEAALLAQGGLEIARFAEHRRDAARHLSSPRRTGAGRTRLQTGNVLPLSHTSWWSRSEVGYSFSAEMQRRSAKMLNLVTLAPMRPSRAAQAGAQRSTTQSTAS